MMTTSNAVVMVFGHDRSELLYVSPAQTGRLAGDLPLTGRGLRRWMVRARALVVALSLVLGCAGQAEASDQTAKAFVQHLGDQVLQILADQSLEANGRVTKLIVLIDDAIDLEVVGRAVLGRHWRVASEEQRRKYLELFRELAVAQVSNLIESYSFSGETFELGQVITLREGKLWEVPTRIERPEGGPVNVQWVVIEKNDGDLALFDFKAEQFSLINTKRDEFGAVISRKGLDGLIEDLQNQIEQKAS